MFEVDDKVRVKQSSSVRAGQKGVIVWKGSIVPGSESLHVRFGEGTNGPVLSMFARELEKI